MSARNTKQLKERHQTVLNDLLREEANRYCADCLAKGPRWASWNLGVFICIRCAGIHRNLGVHISRVKSVNLDSWTPEQMESIQKWGNKRAAEYYECYLPQDFVRPNGDSAMETLIRNKYERKLYIKKDGEPPARKDAQITKPVQEKKKEKPVEQKQVARKPAASVSTAKPKAAKPQESSVPRPHGNGNVNPAKKPPIIDLLGMDNPVPQAGAPQQVVTQDNDNEFDLFMRAAPVNTAQQNQAGPGQQQQQLPSNAYPQTSLPHSNSSSLLLEEAKPSPPTNTKASIMSLYQSGNQQKPMFGVPGGMYVTPQGGMNPPLMRGMLPQQQQQQQQQHHIQMNQSGMRMNQPRVNMNQSMLPPGMAQNQFMKPNMMAMQDQMQNMNLGPRHQMISQQFGRANQMLPGTGQQFMGGNIQAKLGQAIMANSYGPNRPMMPAQQSILANGPTGYANENMGVNPALGHTLNNQLWQ